jgi:hypothetical protein
LALAIFALVRVRFRVVWFFAALLLFGLLAGTNAWPIAQILHRLPLFDVALNDRFAAVVPLCMAVLVAIAMSVQRPLASAQRPVPSAQDEALPPGHRAPGTGHPVQAPATGHPVRAPGTGILPIIMITLTILIALAGRNAPDHIRFAAELAPLALAAVAAWFDARIVILALILIQRTMSDGALVPVFDQRAAYPPLKLFESLPNEPFRITGRGALMLPNTFTMYGLEDVRGSAAMTFAPLAETFPIWVKHEAQQFDEVRDLSSPFVAMLNVRYALLDVSDPIPTGWHDVKYDIYTRLIENSRALPRAFVPRNVRLNAPNELAEMAGETDFADRSWISTRPPGNPATGQAGNPATGNPATGNSATRSLGNSTPNATGSITTTRAKNGLTLDAHMDADAFVVISQTAWDGWRAFVDGRRVALRRANHAFLAVWVPAGEHRVRLVYLPRSFVIGRDITFGALIFLAFGLIRRIVVN